MEDLEVPRMEKFLFCENAEKISKSNGSTKTPGHKKRLT